MTALALWLALQGDRVAELLAALGNDSIQVREEAASRLVRLGTAVEPALEKARRETADPEVAARVGDVLVRIHREVRLRGFSGGAAVDGLSACLKSREDRQKGVLRLTLEVMNVGTGARDLALVDTWNSRLPGKIDSSSAAQAGLAVLQISGERPKRISLTSAGAGDPVLRTVRLLPGESRTFEQTLDLRQLAPGEYALHAEYFAKKLLRAEGDLRSNTVLFKAP
jgi:hypothetical protein